MGIDSLKGWTKAAGRAFGPAGLVIGVVITLSSLFQVFFGNPIGADKTLFVGLVIIAVCGAIVVLRLEYTMRQFDSYVGNEHARRLWADGIPATRDTYLQYVRRGDYGVVNRFWLAGIMNIEERAGVTDLHIACEQGSAAIVQGLLERGAEPGGADKSGHTPLMFAARDGHVRVARVLLHHDCAINAKSAELGCSALYTSAANGHAPFVELLLAEGASVDSVDQDNMTPLMAAIARRNFDVGTLLVGGGADLTRIDASGATLMDYVLAFSVPEDIAHRVRDAGVQKTGLQSTGGGHARTGKARVSWQRT